jgi:DNA-binding transcriptional LysR family regulator
VELRHLRYFLAVAEERHFGRAARRLRIAQPPLSRQIQALEEELGFPLFDRSRRRVELTPAGAALFAHAQKVFDTLDFAVNEAKRAATGQTGRITIGYPTSVAFSGLPELIRAFRDRSAGVDVALRELPPQEQLDALRNGRIDVGFIRGPLAEADIASCLIRREPLVLALPEGHPLALRTRIRLDMLTKESFITFPRQRGPAFFDFIMRLCHDAGFTPRVAQEAPQLDMVSLVAAGFGVAILPESFRNARRPGAVFRALDGVPPTELFVAWRRGETSPVVHDFLALVKEVGVRTRPRGARSGEAAPAAT